MGTCPSYHTRPQASAFCRESLDLPFSQAWLFAFSSSFLPVAPDTGPGAWDPSYRHTAPGVSTQRVLRGTGGAFSKQDSLSECWVISAFILGWKSRAFHFTSPAPRLRSPLVRRGDFNGTGMMFLLFRTCGRWIKMIVAFFFPL